MTAPLLVFGWGNPSRGDDAIGPLFIEQLRALAGDGLGGRVEFLDDYQLQIEHALDLAGRTSVLFVDASLDCVAPFEVRSLRAARDVTFTTHALSPESVMEVYRDLHRTEPPPCTLLAIRARRFGLGEQPERLALSHLSKALAWGLIWLASAGEPCGPATVRESGHA
jgi:hydrogenase maturation protease